MTRTRAVPAMFLLAMFSLLTMLQVAIDHRRGLLGEAPDIIWVRSPKILKRLSLGYEGLLADIYWTRAVQYYGGQRRDHKIELSELSPLLDITVGLDPYLIVAYKFGGFILGEPEPLGAARPDQAIELIKKGIVNNPNHWRFWADLGFIYYDQLKDYSKAAAAYLEGSKQPGAAPWMRVMAASITQKGGNRDTSRFLWSEIYQSTEDATIRENAKMHLDGLKALDGMTALQQLVSRYREENGRWPRSFADMAQAGFITKLPKDPEGNPYRIDPNGKVVLDSKSLVKLE